MPTRVAYFCRIAELEHQLRLSDAKCIFTDNTRLPVAMQAAQEVGIPKQSIFLVEGESQDSEVRDMATLFKHGVYGWQGINDFDILSEK